MRRAPALLLFLLGLFATAPTDNTTTYSNKNVDVDYGMTLRRPTDEGGDTTESGAKVSGTKVELFFKVDAHANGYVFSPNESGWSGVRKIKLEVTCAAASPDLHFVRTYTRTDPGPGLKGGGDTDSGPSPTPEEYLEGAQFARIASTEVADGATLDFTVQMTPTLTDAAGNDFDMPVQTHHATLAAYNRVILLATNEEYDATAADGSYAPNTYIANPAVPKFKKAAADAMPLVRPFWTAPYYTVFPDAGKETKWGENASVGDTVWRTQNLDAEMKNYTAFFAFTHGENTSPPHFRASVGPYTVTDGQVYGTEVGAYAYGGRTIPATYQVAIFYACSLGGSTSLAQGFRIDPILQKWKGLAGFGYPCYYLLHHPDDVTLDQHAKKLMGYLSQGLPLAVALDQLQSSYTGHDNMVPQNTGTGGAMLMNSNGSYARLRYVYLESNIFDPLYSSTDSNVRNSVNTWFWLF